MIATYRGDELARDDLLYAVLPALVREGCATRLDLRPLGEGDLRALAAARYGLAPADAARLATWALGRTEGNPLFVAEVLRALEEGVGLPRCYGHMMMWFE